MSFVVVVGEDDCGEPKGAGVVSDPLEVLEPAAVEADEVRPAADVVDDGDDRPGLRGFVCADDRVEIGG